MKKLFLLALVALLVLSACGKKEEEKEAPAETPAQAAEPKLVQELYFFNWSEYIEPEVYDLFEQEYGVQVRETTFGSNEDLLAKLQGGATGFDVIVPSDYMVSTMIELDMLTPLDKARLTNLGNLDPFFADPPYDPGLVYCIPYMWGTTGIGYDTDYIAQPPDSWAYLFDPQVAKQNAGAYSLLNDSTEVLGAALKYLGYSVNSTDPAEIEQAKQLVMDIKSYVHTFDSEQFEDLLANEEIVMAHGWSGDIFQAMAEDESIGYIIPKEGGIVWADNLCVPKEVAKDPDRFYTAMVWIDFLLRPDIAARNVEFVYYASPNAAAKELIPAEILEDPGIYPPDEVMQKMEWSKPLGEAQQLRDRVWTEIKSQ
jgi:spermidine/putrescine transport system substrate-binding protein